MSLALFLTDKVLLCRLLLLLFCTPSSPHLLSSSSSSSSQKFLDIDLNPRPKPHSSPPQISTTHFAFVTKKAIGCEENTFFPFTEHRDSSTCNNV
jgi:hypothetical protein